MAKRYLLMLDHTLGGTGLRWAIKAHVLEEGPIKIDILVPAQDDEHDGAQARLETELSQLRSLGIAASGQLTEAAPFDAIYAAAERDHYDGVLIATHPPAVSRWMHLDLPHHVERALQIPVEWIDASTDNPDEDTAIQIELPRAAMNALEEDGELF
jgi:hypothetical protein